MTPTHSVALTGFAAFCAAIIHDPVISFALMTVILLTCVTVLTHILISCWRVNRHSARKKKLRQEKKNGYLNSVSDGTR